MKFINRIINNNIDSTHLFSLFIQYITEEQNTNTNYNEEDKINVKSDDISTIIAQFIERINNNKECKFTYQEAKEILLLGSMISIYLYVVSSNIIAITNNGDTIFIEKNRKIMYSLIQLMLFIKQFTFTNKFQMITMFSLLNAFGISFLFSDNVAELSIFSQMKLCLINKNSPMFDDKKTYENFLKKRVYSIFDIEGKNLIIDLPGTYSLFSYLSKIIFEKILNEYNFSYINNEIRSKKDIMNIFEAIFLYKYILQLNTNSDYCFYNDYMVFCNTKNYEEPFPQKNSVLNYDKKPFPFFLFILMYFNSNYFPNLNKQFFYCFIRKIITGFLSLKLPEKDSIEIQNNIFLLILFIFDSHYLQYNDALLSQLNFSNKDYDFHYYKALDLINNTYAVNPIMTLFWLKKINMAMVSFVCSKYSIEDGFYDYNDIMQYNNKYDWDYKRIAQAFELLIQFREYYMKEQINTITANIDDTIGKMLENKKKYKTKEKKLQDTMKQLLKYKRFNKNRIDKKIKKELKRCVKQHKKEKKKILKEFYHNKTNIHWTRMKSFFELNLYVIYLSWLRIFNQMLSKSILFRNIIEDNICLFIENYETTSPYYIYELTAHFDKSIINAHINALYHNKECISYEVVDNKNDYNNFIRNYLFIINDYSYEIPLIFRHNCNAGDRRSEILENYKFTADTNSESSFWRQSNSKDDIRYKFIFDKYNNERKYCSDMLNIMNIYHLTEKSYSNRYLFNNTLDKERDYIIKRMKIDINEKKYNQMVLERIIERQRNDEVNRLLKIERERMREIERQKEEERKAKELLLQKQREENEKKRIKQKELERQRRMIQDAFDQQCINHNDDDDYPKLYEEKRKKEDHCRVIEERYKSFINKNKEDNDLFSNNTINMDYNNLFWNSSANNKRNTYDDDIMAQFNDSDSSNDYDNNILNESYSDYSYNPYYSSDSD